MGRDEHQIAPGVTGWLESPAFDQIAPDCLLVSGWAFGAGVRLVDLWATGCGPRRPLRYGDRRDDVAGVYPGEPGAALSGFSGYLEFEGTPGESVPLEVWAALDDGRTVRLFKRRLVPLAPGRDISLIRFAVRQAIQRPRILFSARTWRDARALLARRLFATIEAPVRSNLANALAQTSRAVLTNFLRTGSPLTLAPSATPIVSVIVVVWNRADLTLACLRALAAHADAGAEVIVVDNASTDETRSLLERVRGVMVIRNDSNVGFTVGANLGAKEARGEFLLFLNSDAELLPGSLDCLLETARSARAIGAVGGKLVFPDGRLQEAGSIIWSDGSCDAYGRGGDPAAPEYDFERRVDFCSAALLLTPRRIFETLGGFDERYRPAYYEDADYCARLWERDYAVVYQPRAVAIHHEFGSATSATAATDLQKARRPIFVSQHAHWLSSQRSRADGLLGARSHPHGQRSVVFVDDAVPDPRMGAGFPRAEALVRALAELGYLTTIYVTGEARPSLASRRRFPDVEVVANGPTGLRRFFSTFPTGRRPDLVIVSRPHNMQYVKAAVGADLSALGAPCAYDAEAVYALREIGRRRLLGPPLGEADGRALIDAELSLARGCAAVLVVSDAERRLFEDAAIPNVSVVAHAVHPAPTPNPFDSRRTVLFVGAFNQESPNEDAVRFLCRDVLPVLRTRERCAAPIVVSGSGIPEALKGGVDSTVLWQSDVDDLTRLYDDARVFVAPTRYSAGIPLKVIEAAARGVPVVCTPLVARQLGWDAGTELLTAEDPGEFARAIASLFVDCGLWQALRDAALTRVATDYSVAVFRSALHRATIGTLGVS
jgi:GT2 family glycosyltransferase